MADVKFFIARTTGSYVCAYEQYDHDSKGMRPCGKKAAILTKRGAALVGLCKEHAEFFLSERSEVFEELLIDEKKEKYAYRHVSARRAQDVLRRS